MKIILETMEDIKDFKELLGVTSTQVPEVEVKKETKKATKKEEKVQAPKVEVKEEPKTEKVEAENVGVDEAPTDTKDTKYTEVKTVTKEDVQNACKIKMKAGKSTEVKEIIKAHGATKISDIKEEDYEKIVAELGVL